MERISDLISLIEKIFNIKITTINSFGNRVIFIGHDFLLDITIENNELIIETISIPLEKRNKGLTKSFIKNLMIYIKEDNILSTLKITAVIASSLNSICKSLDFCHEDFIYPNFNTEDYESFDGFYGSYTKKCS